MENTQASKQVSNGEQGSVELDHYHTRLTLIKENSDSQRHAIQESVPANPVQESRDPAAAVQRVCSETPDYPDNQVTTIESYLSGVVAEPDAIQLHTQASTGMVVDKRNFQLLEPSRNRHSTAMSAAIVNTMKESVNTEFFPESLIVKEYGIRIRTHPHMSVEVVDDAVQEDAYITDWDKNTVSNNLRYEDGIFLYKIAVSNLKPSKRVAARDLQWLKESFDPVAYVDTILIILQKDVGLTRPTLIACLRRIGRADVADLLTNNSSSLHHASVESNVDNVSSLVAEVTRSCSIGRPVGLLSKKCKTESVDKCIPKIAEYLVPEKGESMEELKRYLRVNGPFEILFHLENYNKLMTYEEACEYLNNYPQYFRDEADSFRYVDGRISPNFMHLVISLLSGYYKNNSVAALFPIYEEDAKNGVSLNFDDSVKEKVNHLSYLLLPIILTIPQDTHYVVVVCCLKERGEKEKGLEYWLFRDSGSCDNRRDYCFELAATILKRLGLVRDDDGNIEELRIDQKLQNNKDSCGLAVIQVAISFLEAKDDLDAVKAIESFDFGENNLKLRKFVHNLVLIILKKNTFDRICWNNVDIYIDDSMST